MGIARLDGEVLLAGLACPPRVRLDVYPENTVEPTTIAMFSAGVDCL